VSSPTESEILKAFPKLDASKAAELAAALAAPDKVSENDDEFVKAIDDAMDKANEILDGHGIEAAKGEGSNLGSYWRDTILVYVNLGDTYDKTILFDPDEEEFSIGSWGDFVEEWENEDDEEDDEEEETDDDEEEEEETEAEEEGSDLESAEEGGE
jgi:hypothetical protein